MTGATKCLRETLLLAFLIASINHNNLQIVDGDDV